MDTGTADEEAVSPDTSSRSGPSRRADDSDGMAILAAEVATTFLFKVFKHLTCQRNMSAICFVRLFIRLLTGRTPCQDCAQWLYGSKSCCDWLVAVLPSRWRHCAVIDRIFWLWSKCFKLYGLSLMCHTLFVSAGLPTGSSACKGRPCRVAKCLAEHHGKQRHCNTSSSGHSCSVGCSEAAPSA